MPKFEHLGSKYLKTNFRFEISTFEIVNRQIIVKIRNLILFDRKCPNSGIWAQNFQKTILNFKAGLSKQGADKITFTDQKVDTSLPKNPHLSIWGRILKNKSWQKIPDFLNFEIGSFWVISLFFGGFQLVLARFSLFLILVSTLNVPSTQFSTRHCSCQ